MTTNSNRNESKRPLPKQERKKSAVKKSTFLSRLTKAAVQEFCEDVATGAEEAVQRRTLEAQARAGKERLRLLRKIPANDNDVAKIIRQHAKNCFFYPASGLDWMPLYFCSSECDLFVYCDWNVEASLVDNEITRRADTPEKRWIGQGIQYDEVRRITGANLKWWATTPFHLEPPPAFLYQPPYVSADERGIGFNTDYNVRRSLWGRKYTLRRTVGDQKREITLVYLGLEGVASYWQYFAKQKVAPKYLYWRAANGLGAGNWTDFQDYRQALGRAVEAGADKPTFVSPAGDNWPWNNPVRPFPNWDVTFSSRTP